MARFRDGPPCDELGPGDGVDPRLEPKDRKHVTNRKALQLCAQVQNALNMALADCGDDNLRNCLVENVVPAPDSLHMLVTVRGHEDKVKIQQALQRAAGRFRTEIAAAIHRKKTPQLRFEIVDGSLENFAEKEKGLA